MQPEHEFSKDITETGRCNSQILTSVDVVQDGTNFGLPTLSLRLTDLL